MVHGAFLVLAGKEVLVVWELQGGDQRCRCVQQGKKIKFTWRIENFVAFKEIMETRKIFSRSVLWPG